MASDKCCEKQWGGPEDQGRGGMVAPVVHSDQGRPAQEMDFGTDLMEMRE